MQDLGKGIGDAMVFLAVLVAFAVPTAIGSLIGLVLSVLGFASAALVFGGVGLVAGVLLAGVVMRNA